jgi:hypothetical protein
MLDPEGNVIKLEEATVDLVFGDPGLPQVTQQAVFHKGVEQDLPLIGGEVPAVRPLGEGLEEDADGRDGSLKMIEKLGQALPDQDGGGEVGEAAGDFEPVGIVGDGERAASHNGSNIPERGTGGKAEMTKGELKRKMDAIWYAAQHRIWKRCAVSGETPVEIHHLIPKGNLATRWEKENGIGLVKRHHTPSTVMSAHGTPKAFMDWLKRKRPNLARWVEDNRHRIEPSVNLNDKMKELKEWAGDQN